MPPPSKKREDRATTAEIHAVVKSAVEGALDGLSLKDYVKIGIGIAAIVIYLLTYFDKVAHDDQTAKALKIQTDSTFHKQRIMDSITSYQRDSAQVSQHNQIIRSDDSIIHLLTHKKR